MAATTEKMITKAWQKVSDGDCTLQTVSSNELLQFAASTAAPTTAFYQDSFGEITNVAFGMPVWVRLNQSATRTTEVKMIVTTKQGSV